MVKSVNATRQVPRSRRERQLQACCPELIPASLTGEQIDELAIRFKALGDATRLTILALLAANDDGVCVCDITEDFDLGQPTISHHLRILRAAGLVSSTRRRSWAYYSLHPATAAWVRQMLAAVWR